MVSIVIGLVVPYNGYLAPVYPSRYILILYASTTPLGGWYMSLNINSYLGVVNAILEW